MFVLAWLLTSIAVVSAATLPPVLTTGQGKIQGTYRGTDSLYTVYQKIPYAVRIHSTIVKKIF